MMRAIKIRRRGFLQKWHAIRHLLLKRTIKHPRAPWICYPSHTSKKPHWYLRKQNRRRLKRMKKIEAMWAKYRKPKRLHERQLEVLREQAFQEELQRRLKTAAPFYRMMRQHFITGINCFEATKRSLDAKKSILIYHHKAQKTCNYHTGYLRSSSVAADILKDVKIIGTLTEQKMQGDKDFKDVLVQRKLVKRTLVDKRKFFLSVLIPLAEYYHSIKIFKNTTIPKYFRHIEKLMYQERNFFQPSQLVFERYLKCTRDLDTSLLVLHETFEKMKLCLTNRLFFTNEVTKVENRLSYGKNIILQLLRSGHEVLTNLFIYYSAYYETEYLGSTHTAALEERRADTYSKRRDLEMEVQQLLQRHRSHREARVCPSYLPNVCLDGYSKDELAAILYPLHKNRRIFHERRYLDDVENNFTDKVWTRYSINIKALRILAEKTYMNYNNISLRTADENNIALYFEIRQKNFSERIEQVLNLSMDWTVRCWIYYVKHLRRKSRVHKADNRALYKYFHGLEDRRAFERGFKAIFQFTKRTSEYKSGMLGTYHKMVNGNRDVCVKAEFKFFRMFLMIKHSLTSLFIRNIWFDVIQEQEDKKSREFVLQHGFMRTDIGLRKQTIRKFKVEKFHYITVCPLCVMADRRLYIMGRDKRVDWFEDTSNLEKEGFHLILGTKKINYLHYFEECPQPEATSVVGLRVLKDRKTPFYKNDDAWIKYD